MKYIFDFDDVLFNNTKQFKEYIYIRLAKAGVSRAKAEKYYNETRENQFSLRSFLKHLFEIGNIDESVEDVYQEIMQKCPNFLNQKIINEIKNIGVENCYIVTAGNEEFQRDKIKYSGVINLIDKSRIKIVKDSKSDAIEEICKENPGEEIVFVDDRKEKIDEISKKDFPNVVTIHYKEDIVNISEIMKNKELVKELRGRQ